MNLLADILTITANGCLRTAKQVGVVFRLCATKRAEPLVRRQVTQKPGCRIAHDSHSQGMVSISGPDFDIATGIEQTIYSRIVSKRLLGVNRFVYRVHALQRMFERAVVESVISVGHDYPHRADYLRSSHVWGCPCPT